MEYLHFFISSTLLIYLGFMIHFRDKAEWIAGFQDVDIKNRKQLTTLMGVTGMIMGLLLTPILLFLLPTWKEWNMMIYFAITILGVIIMVVGSNSIK